MLALDWNPATLTGDLAREAGGRLADDPSLRTAVILSLFLDRRARSDDATQDGDRRGWLGDALSPVTGDRIGSRLWLLRREKQLPETLRRAEDYAREALAWLVEDGLARRVTVAADWLAMGLLGLRVEIESNAGRQAEVFGMRI
ncbi:MAG TPA: phage GP46 family protein [Roseomonas sp.]|jgi:phage gp46-like protein